MVYEFAGFVLVESFCTPGGNPIVTNLYGLFKDMDEVELFEETLDVEENIAYSIMGLDTPQKPIVKPPKLTNQEVFNKVAAHLLTQGCRSWSFPVSGRISLVKTCMYRSKDGAGNVLKCAAGIFIPDDLYVPEFEECSIVPTYKEYGCYKVVPDKEAAAMALNSVFDSVVEDMQFLKSCQKVHDHSEVRLWKAELQKLAISHDLDYSILGQY